MRAWWQAAGGPHLGRVEITGSARGPLVDLRVELRYLLAHPAMPPGIQPELPETLVEVLAVPDLHHAEVVYAGRGWAQLSPLRQGEIRMVQKGPAPEGERRRVELRIRALAPRDGTGRRRVVLGLGPLPIQTLAARFDVAGAASAVNEGPWRWRTEAGEGSTRLTLEAHRLRGNPVLVASWIDRLEASPPGDDQGLLVEDLGDGGVRWLPPDQIEPTDRGVPVDPEPLVPLLAASLVPVKPPRPPVPSLPTVPTTWFSSEDLTHQCRARQARLAKSFERLRGPGGVPPRWPEGWDETVTPASEGEGRGVVLRPRRARLALPRERGEWFPLAPLLPWLADAGVLDFHPSDPGNVRETLEHFLILGDGSVACLVHGSHATPRKSRSGQPRSARDQLKALGVTDPELLNATYDGPLY